MNEDGKSHQASGGDKGSQTVGSGILDYLADEVIVLTQMKANADNSGGFLGGGLQSLDIFDFWDGPIENLQGFSDLI